MSADAGGAQTAAERRAAEGDLRTLIERFSPEKSELVSALRRTLRKRLPTAHEVVYEYRDCFVLSFSASERGYEGVFAIRGSAKGVALYFQGVVDLPDPEGLLRGSGSKARFLDVEGASTLARPAVARLIDEAIARNPVPFAREGRGSVVVRATSARKRRGSRPA